MENKLIVSELFTSIQGESSYAGRPCFFIRLAGCNLSCSYCDTQYAKNEKDGKAYSVSELLKEVKSAGISLVEITGGEPLLQGAVKELCESLLKEKYQVLIETNGSIGIDFLPRDVIKILDCKCPASEEAAKMDFANFNLLTKDDEIKFVISDRKDYEYAISIIKEYDLSKKVTNILFSPDQSKSTSAEKLAEWILEDHAQVRLQLQLHKIIWDPEERGK